MDCCEYIILRVKGGLGWGKVEGEKFVHFGDESEVVTGKLLKWYEIQVATVEAYT